MKEGFVVEMDLNHIRYSQSSISEIFKNGNSLERGIKDIKSGKWKPVIEITKFEDKKYYFSLDNRRLFCLKSAKAKNCSVIFKKYNPKKHCWKVSTRCNGEKVKIEGDIEDEKEDIIPVTNCEFWKIEKQKYDSDGYTII